MSNKALCLLGPDTPFMQSLEAAFKRNGIPYAYAVDSNSERVQSDNAYKAIGYVLPNDSKVHLLGPNNCSVTHRIHCGWSGFWEMSDIVTTNYNLDPILLDNIISLYESITD